MPPTTNAKASRQGGSATDKMQGSQSHAPGAGASLVDGIKRRLTLREAARMVGVELPERDGVRFRSPLRPDRSPSCTIQGDTMRDWSRGESFDCIAFFAAAKGMSNAEAIKTLSGHLGITSAKQNAKPPRPARQSPPPPPPPSAPVTFEDREPSDDDYAAILRSRKLPPEAEAGLVLAHTVGVLRFATVGGFPSWLVTDERRTIAEARRLDGLTFPEVGTLGARKAHTLKGSRKDWPAGLAPRVSANRLRELPLVLAEGGPDLLCAYALLAILPMDARDVQPAAMLGTAASISAEALAMMSRRPCIILAHGDEAGRAAAGRWAGQLTKAGCRVTLRELPDGCDLNDAASAHGLNAMKGAILP